MQITSGLFPHMVIGRNRRNLCDQAVEGMAYGKSIILSVTHNGKPVGDSDQTRVASVRKGAFRFRLRGLAVGGPYTVTLTAQDKAGKSLESIRIDDILVGDVWVLAGQSNMQGIGNLAAALPPHPQVRALFMHGEWGVAKDPIHNLWEARAEIHKTLGATRFTTKGVGPGVAFGQAMFVQTGVPQGLIACAHGGSSMNQWRPTEGEPRDDSLFGAMLNRIENSGGRITGMLWYQGESDANSDCVPLYTDRMKTLIEAVRRQTDSPRLPVVIVQLSRVIGDNWSAEGWNGIREAQRLLTDQIRRLLVVPAIDLALDDLIHVAGRDQNRLGKRLCLAMVSLIRGRRAQKPPIVLRRIRCVPGKQEATIDVILEYGNVTGALQASGRPSGFVFVRDGVQGPVIFDIHLKRNRVILKTTSCDTTDFADKSLYYGFGRDPYCNITDEDDRSLPAFGPMPVVEP